MLGIASFDHSSTKLSNGVPMIRSSAKKWTLSRGAAHLYTVRWFVSIWILNIDRIMLHVQK